VTHGEGEVGFPNRIPECRLLPLYVRQMVPGDEGWVEPGAVRVDKRGKALLLVGSRLYERGQAENMVLVKCRAGGYDIDLASAPTARFSREVYGSVVRVRSVTGAGEC